MSVAQLAFELLKHPHLSSMNPKGNLFLYGSPLLKTSQLSVFVVKKSYDGSAPWKFLRLRVSEGETKVEIFVVIYGVSRRFLMSFLVTTRHQ